MTHIHQGDSSSSIATRKAFGDALKNFGADYPSVVVLDADLSKSTMSKSFADAFPERFFEMGIQEANMIGSASGLALSGYNAFCCSFACFLTGRFDQIKMSVAYSEAPVRLIGTHAGVGIGEDGYSQQGLEDIALMRSLPGMDVFQPGDGVETAALIKYLMREPERPAYVRLTRQAVTQVHDSNYDFQRGKMTQLTEGTDVTLIASGGTVCHAKTAAEKLSERGLSVRVYNAGTIKPIDGETLAVAAEETGLIVTAEDHNVIGGLGGAVSEWISENHPVPVVRHGVRDVFGESGTPDALYRKHRLDSDGIAEVVEAAHAKWKGAQ